MSELRWMYEAICQKYVQKFAKKHGYPFDYWIGDEVGGMASFCEQYFFNFNEIVYDINNRVPKGLIFRWQDDCVEHPDSNINFKSYAMGLRHNMLTIKRPEEQERIKEFQQEIDELSNLFLFGDIRF